MTGVLRELMATMLPVVVAALTTLSMEGLQRVLAWVHRLPAVAKRVVVVLLSFVLTRVALVVGAPLGVVDVTALGEADVSALLSGSLAYLFHLGDQARAARGGGR